jgi:hypothetical protein
LKHINLGGFALLLFGMAIALTSIVCADQPVPAVPEAQTLGTVTTADVVGLTMETDAGTWSLAGVGMLPGYDSPIWANAPGSNYELLGGMTYLQYIKAFYIAAYLSTGISWEDYWSQLLNASDPQVKINMTNMYNYAVSHNPTNQYATIYDANIMAQAGHTVFSKTMNIDTRNKVIGQSNLDAKTGLTFIATSDGGNVVGSENLMIDGTGIPTKASDRMLCPFGSQPVDVIPAYCNIVQAGSKYDLTIGSVSTNANDRFVGTDATNPVVLNYDINIKPYGTSQGQILASGSTMVYLKAHIQEGRGFNNTNLEIFTPVGPLFVPIDGTPTKSEDLVYNEQSSAQGTITSFNKVIAYQSGKSLL